jgi:hypothetical protein
MSIYSPFKITNAELPQSIFYEWPEAVTISTVVIYADCSFGYTGPLEYEMYLDESEDPVVFSSLQRAYGPQIINLPEPESASKLEIRFKTQAWSESLSISEIQIFSTPPTPDKLLTRYTNFSIDWRYQYRPSDNRVRFTVKNPPVGYTNWGMKLCAYDASPVSTPEAIVETSGTFPFTESGVSWQVPPLPTGAYMLLLTMTGTGLDPLVEDRFFARTESEWEEEGGDLGATEVLLPGFTSLTVTEPGTVNAVHRGHVQSGIGLWDQVTSKGRELLVSPVRIEARSGDVVSVATGSGLTFTETSGLRVSGTANWSTPAVSGTTAFEYEQDGLMNVTLNVNVPTSTIQSLKVIIPLRESECYLFHPVGTGFRNHFAGQIPQGTGVVWNSDSAPSKLNDRFIPYIYVGGPERGVCFAADNDKDWFPNSRVEPVTSCMEIVRAAGRVELHLNLISGTPSVSRAREIKFSLQATPVKSAPSDWRKWWATRTGSDVADTHLDFWGSDLFWGGDSYATSFAPVNKDYEVFTRLNSYRDTGNRDNAWENGLLTSLSNRPDFANIDEQFKEGWGLAARARRGVTKKTSVFPYTNSRGSSYFKNREFLDTYIDEWMSWDISDPAWSASSTFERPRRVHTTYSGDENWYNVEPVESRVNFLLWHYKKMLDTFADGINLDGIYLVRNYYPHGPGYVDDAGVPRAGVNLLAFRQLFKRCATMMHGQGMQPLIHAHMTNVNITPILSFGAVSLDWDWRDTGAWVGRDLQDRVDNGLVLAQSTGLQSGSVPVAMTGKTLVGSGNTTREWLHRTGIAVALPHEVRMNQGTDDVRWVQEQLLSFGYGDPAVTVWRYWDNNPAFPITFAGEGVVIRALALTKDGEALIVVGNWSTGRESYSVRMTLDLQAMGMGSSLRARDLEVSGGRVIARNSKNTTVAKTEILSSTGAGVFEFPIVHNDFAIIKVEKVEVPPEPEPEPEPETPVVIFPDNLLLNSEEFNLSPPWNAVNSVITPNTELAPDENVSADTYTEGPATSNNSILSQVCLDIIPSNWYTYSVHVKRGNNDWYQLALRNPQTGAGGLAYYNVATGVVGSSASIGTGSVFSSSMVSLPGGWYRLRLTVPSDQATSLEVSLHSSASNGSANRVGNSFAYIFGAMLDPSKELRDYIPTSEPPEPEPDPEDTVIETFSTLESTTENGWVGSGNLTGGNNFSWKSSDIISGSGTAGCAGGVFARSSELRYFADASIGEISRTSRRLRLAGSFRLVNSSFDGSFYLGYFSSDLGLNKFMGIQFSEPTTVSGPFRGRIQVNESVSSLILFSQNTLHEFDLTWVGASDGSGTLSGSIAGQFVSLTVAAGSSIFSLFGILSGGMSNSTPSQVTGQCLFDNLTYNKVGVIPGPDPDPEPPTTTEFDTRANWMIGTYENVTIGGSSPNGADGQKFGWADILARLRLNPNNRQPIQRFLDLMQNGSFNGAFMTAGAAWIMCKYWDKFTEAERNNIILPRFRSVNNILSHGTENHFLVRYVGTHLWAQLWPDETSWYNIIEGRRNTSQELRTFTKSRLLTVLRSLYDKGLDEYLSPNYLPVHFYPLHTLYTCVTDPELKAAANAVLTYHMSEMAANYFEGSTIASYNREAPQQRSLPQSNKNLNTHIKALYWLYWAETMNVSSTPPVTFPSAGSTGSGGEAKHFAVTSALSDWRPPNLLVDLALGRNILPFSLKSAYCQFGEFATGPAGYAIRNVYRSQNFAVGTANFSHRLRSFNEKAGYEIFYKSNDNQNTIVCHHPYWRTNTQHSTITAPGTFTNPAQSRWLARSSPFQQNVQHESTAISLFNIPATDPFQGRTEVRMEEYRLDTRDAQGVNRPIQEAWVRYPKNADEVVETNGWVFLREGPTYIAIRSWLPYTKVTNEFTDLDVIRSSGPKNVVIVDLANASDFASFAAFRTAVLAAPLTVNLTNLSVSYRNTKGDTISAQYNEYSFTTDVINSFPTFSVNGTAQVVRDADFTAGRAVIKSSPISLVNRVLTVNLPSGRLTVDWSGSTPVFSNPTTPTPPPPTTPPPSTPTGSVPALDPSTINPSLFTGEEYKYGYFLTHLATVANSVVMTPFVRDGITYPKGYIDRVVWRSRENNFPGNARVLENHVAFTFFYTANRPWNPYRGNQALKVRLEAVLDYLVDLSVQDTSGQGRIPSDFNGLPITSRNYELAGTAFGVKFLGETLLMLETSRQAGGPTINSTTLQRTITACRKAINTLLDNVSWKTSATRFSNQYSGFWGGVWAFLLAHPDNTLRQKFLDTITLVYPTMSSPAGYHYESSGPDWSYTLLTHYNGVQHVWERAQGSSLIDISVDLDEKWVEWLSYNAVREPDGSYYTLNRGIQTRISTYPGFTFAELPLSGSLPISRAFSRTQVEWDTFVSDQRQKLIREWPRVSSLSTYAPGLFAGGINTVPWRPTAAQKNAAIASLPYLASTNFNHQRADKNGMGHTYIRRASYYAAFNTATRVPPRDITRFGLGLIWNPQMGTVLQTPSSRVSPWGTALPTSVSNGVGSYPNEFTTFESKEFPVTVRVAGQVTSIQQGARNLPNGVVVFEYNIFNNGTKTVTFNTNSIDVNIQMAGVFSENFLLLLQDNESVVVSGNTASITRNGVTFRITASAGARITRPTGGTGWPPSGTTPARLRIEGTNTLSYSIAFI